MLYQRCATFFRRFVTFFWRCFNVGHWRCINVVHRWKSDVGFYFIFNVGSTYINAQTTLIRHWNIGWVITCFTIFPVKMLDAISEKAFITLRYQHSSTFDLFLLFLMIHYHMFLIYHVLASLQRITPYKHFYEVFFYKTSLPLMSGKDHITALP